MCKAKKPKTPAPPPKPEFLRNPYLDAAIGQASLVSALRTGRSGLRIRRGSDTPSANRPGGLTGDPDAVSINDPTAQAALQTVGSVTSVFGPSSPFSALSNIAGRRSLNFS